MRLVLHGGFGEKGRTCMGVESDGYRLLLDAGVKTSARGSDDYYPAIVRSDAGGDRRDRDHARARRPHRGARLVPRARIPWTHIHDGRDRARGRSLPGGLRVA